MPESRDGITVVSGVLGYCTVRKHVKCGHHIVFTVSVHTVQVCSVKCQVYTVSCTLCTVQSVSVNG